MECAQCGGWIHAKCEGIDGEEYQVLSFLPDSIEYVCKCKAPIPRQPTGKKSTNSSIRSAGADSYLEPQVLIPVASIPSLLQTSQSPAREYSQLQAMDQVPPLTASSIASLETVDFYENFDSVVNLDVSVNIDIPSTSRSDVSAKKSTSNSFINVMSTDYVEPHEISPKPSEAIDEEHDYVTLDSSDFALPAAIETMDTTINLN